MYYTHFRNLRVFNERPAGVEYKFVYISDKSKAAMQRVFPQRLLFAANDIGPQPPFEDASIAANQILNSG